MDRHSSLALLVRDHPRLDCADGISISETEFPSTIVPRSAMPSDRQSCFCQLAGVEDVDRAMPDRGAWSIVAREAWAPNISVFSGALTDGTSLYARMFASAIICHADRSTRAGHVLLWADR